MKPELYNNFNEIQYRDAVDIIRKFNDLYEGSPTEGSTLLDIGTGCGKVLIEVTIGQSNLNFKNVFGVDINQEMVGFAKKKYESEMIRFHCVDTVGEASALEKAMNDLSVGFGFADIVTSFNCLNWVVDLRRAFANINNLLKSSGWFLCVIIKKFVIYDALKAASIDDKFSDIMHDLSEVLPAATTEYSLQILNEICKKFQLETRLLEEHKTYFDYQSRSNFRASMKAVCPYVSQMTDEKQNDFVDFLEEYLNKSNKINNPSDPYKAEYEVIFLIARKSSC